MKSSIDPRVKFLITAFITSIVVIGTNISLLIVNLFIGLVFSLVFGAKLGRIIKKFRSVLYLLMFIIIIQSIFTTDGTPLLKIFGLRIITDTGIKRGIAYMLRIMTILVSGAIISTTNMADTLRGFTKIGLPYEIAFSASLGIRFLPVLMDEISSTYTAIQMRGIDIRRLKLAKRIEMTAYLFMPVIYSTINRSKKLSESAENRGFKIGGERTYYRDIKFKAKDYMICLAVILFFSGIIYFFGSKGGYYEGFISNWIHAVR